MLLCILKKYFSCYFSSKGHYGNTTKADRQEVLKKVFHFECQCLACTDDYPTEFDLPQTYSSEDSRYNTTATVDQQLRLEMDNADQKMNEVLFNKLQKSDLDGMIDIYCKKTDMAHQARLLCPHLLYEKCKAGLSDCLWLKYGNRGPGFRQKIPVGIYT